MSMCYWILQSVPLSPNALPSRNMSREYKACGYFYSLSCLPFLLTYNVMGRVCCCLIHWFIRKALITFCKNRRGVKRTGMRVLHNWWTFKIGWLKCPSQRSGDPWCVPSTHALALLGIFCVGAHSSPLAALFSSLYWSHFYPIWHSSSPPLLWVFYHAPQSMIFCRQHLLQRAQVSP